MRQDLGKLAAIGLAAIALCGIGPGAAHAAKVSDTAKGGVVPPAIEVPDAAPATVPFVQRFRFEGPKVKGARIVDVNVTVNAFGSAPGSNGDLAALLVDPKGDVDTAVDPKGGSVPLPIPRIGSAMAGLTFDDESLLIPCNPFEAPEITNCNNLQGGTESGSTGTMTGRLNASINPQFDDSKPKGTWKLIWRDGDADDVISTIGRARLTLKLKSRG